MGNRQPLRRPPPNPLKLSGFVEIFTLIILVIKVSEIEPIFIEIQIHSYNIILTLTLKKES
jgi:hypothetical protein